MFGIRFRNVLIFFFVISSGFEVFALEPEEILVITNKQIPESVELGRYYCQRRSVPGENVLALELGPTLSETINRDDYNTRFVGPIREMVNSRRFIRPIRCLLTTYGVPFRVAGRGKLQDRDEQLKELEQQQQRLKQRQEAIKQEDAANSSEVVKSIDEALLQVKLQIDYILGRETSASVDSELSMVLFDNYELFRWQLNELKDRDPFWDFKTVMVCRIDGPSFEIARGLVDKSLLAETNDLKGNAYIDSGYSLLVQKPLYQQYDRSLKDLAWMLSTQTQMPVVMNSGSELFSANQCPSTALYCGWYSLSKYVDAFDFVDGAIGYHIASLEAVNLRDPNSTQWCPAMLTDGITATLGAVDEPYLQSIPKPDEFFAELLNGRCLVEAYYKTQPFNSWQLVLIGDPLYRPFKKR
jgi:uncharacterized protein (TIGR03790 family)